MQSVDVSIMDVLSAAIIVDNDIVTAL